MDRSTHSGGTRRRRSRSGWLLGSGFVALSLFIAAAVVFSVQQRSGDAIVRGALTIEINLADVFSALQDAEIGQRGFLLTNDPAFLAPYHVAGERLATLIGTLEKRLATITEQRDDYARLRSLASEKQIYLDHTLALHRSGRADEALALVRSGRGRQLMDSIRDVIKRMDEYEDAVVERREAQLRWSGFLTAFSTIGAVVLLGCVALAAMREVRRRGELARFLPAEIAPRLAAGDVSLRNGRELPAAIVFVDIRGSTELAEHVPVATLSLLLSTFRSHVLAAAETSGGLVDKFIGDGALVVFGVHDGSPRAASQALTFARDLRGRHRAMQAAARGPSYEIGMGIHYGSVFCGIVGDEKRLEFTVLGDVVNVAARLEKETKRHRVDLLASDAVLREAGEALDRWHDLGRHSLRGRRAAISVYAERDRAARPNG